MAAVHIVQAVPVVHQPLVVFMHDLETHIGAGTTTSFLTALGRRLVLGHVLAEKDFPKSGTPTPADLGILTKTLHGLGNLVNWAGVNTGSAPPLSLVQVAHSAKVAVPAVAI